MASSSISSLQAKLRVLLNKVRVIPYGFKRVFFEGKAVIQILNKRPSISPSPSVSSSSSLSQYTRRERETLRKHFSSIRKLVLFVVVQLPPGIGYVPILLALRFPRQILTYHFYDDDPPMLRRFLREEFSDRAAGATELVTCYEGCGVAAVKPAAHEPVSATISVDDKADMVLNKNDASTSGGTDSSTSASVTEQAAEAAVVQVVTLRDWYDIINKKDPKCSTQTSPSLSHISKRQYLQLLAKSNMICDSNFGVKLSPSIFLRFWMAMRIKEILQDDILLISEGLDKLTVYELQEALLRRGFAPEDDVVRMRKCLLTWLTEMITETDRSEILNEGYFFGNYLHSKSAALMHLIAYNATLNKCEI